MAVPLDHSSAVLETLTELYQSSTLGKTGIGSRDFGEPYSRLLKRANATAGPALSLAQKDLQHAESTGALKIERNKRSHDPERIRVSLLNEPVLFRLLGKESPTARRQAWATMLKSTAQFAVPQEYQATWHNLCQQRAQAALVGKGLSPFRWEYRRRAAAQLQIIAELLGWNRPCFVRTASAQIAGSSKFFERCIGTLESLLKEASGGKIRSLLDLNIRPNPTKVRFHGAIRLHLRGMVKDYVGLYGESALSELDLNDADVIDIDAPRCITIENATTFHELCKLECKDLLVFTSYPNQATVNFIKLLNGKVQCHHWGDSDPWGFDVLRDLRRKTGHEIIPLNMHFGFWAETLPHETRARRELTSHDREKLAYLLGNETMQDVWGELQKMKNSGITGDFEQEGLHLLSGEFPYLLNTG